MGKKNKKKKRKVSIRKDEIMYKRLPRKLYMQNERHLLQRGRVLCWRNVRKESLRLRFFSFSLVMLSPRWKYNRKCETLRMLLLSPSLSCSGSQACIARSSVIKSLIAFTSPLLSLSLCFCISLSLSYSSTVRAAVKAERKSLKASSSDVKALSIVAADIDDHWHFVKVQETSINDKWS